MAQKKCNRALIDQSVAKTRARIRRIKLFVKFFAVSLIIATSLFVLIMTSRIVIAGNFLPIKRIEVVGDFSRILPSEITDLSGIKKGQGLFSFDVENVRKNLAKNKWIKQSFVRRIPPSTLRIEVIEHTPIAIALVNGNIWFVDAEGKPIKQRVMGEPADLIVISGINKDDNKKMIESINLAEKLRELTKTSVSQINYSEAEGFAGVLSNGIFIYLGNNSDWDAINQLWPHVSGKDNPRYVLANERGRLIVGYPIMKGGDYGQKG